MFKPTWVVVAVFVASACGGESTPDPVVAEPTTAGSVDAAPGATDVDEHESQPSTLPPAGSSKRTPCVFGQDQTCNSDPSVSALWGKCTETGTCECNTGFVLAPTGYCEPAS